MSNSITNNSKIIKKSSSNTNNGTISNKKKNDSKPVTKVTDTKVTDTKVTNTKVSDTKVSDTKVSDTKVSNTKTKLVTKISDTNIMKKLPDKKEQKKKSNTNSDELDNENNNNKDNNNDNDRESVSIMDTLISITGEKDEKTILIEMVDFIYTNTHCLGGKHKGILYKELPNTWSQRNTFTDDEKKYECSGTCFNDCTVQNEINKYVKGNVNLIWKFNKEKKDGTLNLQIYDNLKHLNNPKVLGFIKNFSKLRKNIFLNKTIKITNNSGDSEDHRGSNHCLIDLPMDTNIILTNPTLEEFIEAFWLIKYKKFDTNYEMCVGSKLSVKNNIITINVNFDNGS